MTPGEFAEYEREREDLMARYDRPIRWSWETAPFTPPAPDTPRATVWRILQLNADAARELGLIVPPYVAEVAQGAPESSVRRDRDDMAIVIPSEPHDAPERIVTRDLIDSVATLISSAVFLSALILIFAVIIR